MSSQEELYIAMGSMLDVLHLHPDGVDMVIDTMLDTLTMMSDMDTYPPEALSVIKKRAEAIREAVKNNPLPAQSTPCKPLVQ